MFHQLTVAVLLHADRLLMLSAKIRDPVDNQLAAEGAEDGAEQGLDPAPEAPVSARGKARREEPCVTAVDQERRAGGIKADADVTDAPNTSRGKKERNGDPH